MPTCRYMEDVKRMKTSVSTESMMTSSGKKKLKKPSLYWCLCKIFYGKFLAGAFLRLVVDSKRILFIVFD
jgi:hypothetical protein